MILHDYVYSKQRKTQYVFTKYLGFFFRIHYVEGFGVCGKELIIHVLEDHEEEIEPRIKDALGKHPFDGKWRTEIFYKTDYRSNSIQIVQEAIAYIGK